MAISGLPIPCEIASVASLPRNDIATQSLKKILEIRIELTKSNLITIFIQGIMVLNF
jgi:hypothetical protein